MKRYGSYEASDLEQEFDLEMEEGEADSDFESDVDSELDFEDSQHSEAELAIGESLAERLAGLAAREYESEAELDDALNEAFEDAQEQFLSRALGKVGAFARRAAPKLLKATGLNLDSLKKLLPMDLLKKSLMTAAKAAMASNPALAALAPALGPALQSLGLGESEFDESNSEAWQTFEVMGENAYEYMVRNLSDKAVQPLAAMQLAARSLKYGADRARTMPGARSGAPAASTGAGRRREIRVRAGRIRPGDRIVIRFI